MKTIHSKLMSIGAALLLISTLIPLPTTAATSACRDVDIIFARGSGENLGVTDPTQQGYPKIRNDLFNRLRTLFNSDTSLSVGYLDLAPGLEGTTHAYKAAGVSEGSGWERLVRLYNAAESSLNDDDRAYLGGYNGSVNEGKLQLIEYISSKAQQCPNTRYIVSGYSQGAHVVGNALNDSAMIAYLPKISYVALFGDPKLNIGTDAAGNPTPTEDVAWFEGGKYKTDIGGVLKPRYAYLPTSLKFRSSSSCLNGDSICSNTFKFPDYRALLNNTAHESYTTNIDPPLKQISYRIAMQTKGDLWLTLNRIIQVNGNSYKTCIDYGKLDIAVLIDTSKTMSDNYFFRDISTNVRRIFESSCDIRVSVVKFGPLTNPSIQTVSGFSRSPAAISQAILSQRNPQQSTASVTTTAVRPAILHALNQPSWRVDADKAILILTDAVGDGFPYGVSENAAHTMMFKETISQLIETKIKEHKGVTFHPAMVGARNGISNVNGFAGYYRYFTSRYGGYDYIGYSGYPSFPTDQKIGCIGLGAQCTWGEMIGLQKQLQVRPQATVPHTINATLGQPKALALTNATPGPFMQGGALANVRWDLNCDGILDTSTGASGVNYVYTFTQPLSCTSKVRVEATTAPGYFTYFKDYYFNLDVTP